MMTREYIIINTLSIIANYKKLMLTRFYDIVIIIIEYIVIYIRMT